MSSNEAASTEPLPEYAFGPWITCTGTHPAFPIGAHYQCDCSTHIARVNSERDQATPYGPAAKRARRAYRIGEWYPHDGGPCPLEGSQMVEVDYALGATITARHANTRHWPTVKRFRPIAPADNYIGSTKQFVVAREYSIISNLLIAYRNSTKQNASRDELIAIGEAVAAANYYLESHAPG